MTFDPTAADDEGGENGEQEEQEFLPSVPQRDAVIFAVDCSDVNLAKSAFVSILTCLRSKIWTSNGADRVSILLYNVDDNLNPLGVHGVSVAVAMADLSLDVIKRANGLVSFTPTVGHCELSDLFWIVCNLIDVHAPQGTPFNRRLFVFTASDDPVSSDQAKQRIVTQRVTDLQEKDMLVDIFPLKPQEDFDFSKFWLPVLQVAFQDVEDFHELTTARFEEISTLVMRRLYRKQALNVVDFFIGKLRAMCRVYSNVMPASKPKSAFVSSDTHNLAKPSTAYYSTLSGSIVNLADDVIYFGEVAKNLVPCDRQDMLSFKDFPTSQKVEEPSSGSIHLIGFLPRNALSPHRALTHSYFLYPYEERMAGSNVAIAALIDSMSRKNVVALVRFFARQGSAPRFAALLPQTKSETLEWSNGLHLVILPFEDEVRKLEYPEISNPERLDAAEDLLKAFKIDSWHPDQIDNPALAKMHAGIEAIALGLSEPVPFDDALQPSKNLSEKAAPAISEWKQIGGPFRRRQRIDYYFLRLKLKSVQWCNRVIFQQRAFQQLLPAKAYPRPCHPSPLKRRHHFHL